MYSTRPLDRSPVGFCWGCSSIFAYAVSQPESVTAAVYYGSSPSEALLEAD
jgi:dienelactone hydrolase